MLGLVRKDVVLLPVFYAPKLRGFFTQKILPFRDFLGNGNGNHKAVDGPPEAHLQGQPGPYNLWPFIGTQVNLGHLLEKHKEHLCLEQSKPCYVGVGGRLKNPFRPLRPRPPAKTQKHSWAFFWGVLEGHLHGGSS